MNLGLGGLLHGFSFGAGFELTRRIVVPAILVATPLVLWWWIGPEKPTCDAVRSQAARIAVVQVADRIQSVRGDARRAAVMHFKNDPTDFVTRELRRRLMDNGTFDLDAAPIGEKIRNLLNLRSDGLYDVEKALDYGRRQKLDAVVVGAIDVFETVNGKAVLSGVVKFIRVGTGESVDIPLTADKIGGIAPPDVTETISLPLRLLLMAGCIVIIPILTFPFLRLVMRRDSNLATAGVLVLLLAVDGLIISLILGMSATFCGLVVFLIVLAAAFGYDLFMLSYAQLCKPAIGERC